jgi:hypothetical protein
MARPVKWSRDLHPIRDRATRSKTETWSRQDIEQLFNVGRASAQTLMKAIGEVQEVGGTHFVQRASLLSFLDEMIQADSVEEALRSRQERASPIPRPKPLRISLPEDLRHITLADLPFNVHVSEGEVRVTGANAEEVVEGLFLLAQVLQNDLDAVRAQIDPPPEPPAMDDDLREMLRSLREHHPQ